MNFLFNPTDKYFEQNIIHLKHCGQRLSVDVRTQTGAFNGYLAEVCFASMTVKVDAIDGGRMTAPLSEVKYLHVYLSECE